MPPLKSYTFNCKYTYTQIVIRAYDLEGAKHILMNIVKHPSHFIDEQPQNKEK